MEEFVMFRPTIFASSLLISGLILGCGLHERTPLLSMFPFGKSPNLESKEIESRQKFLVERDPESLRWLLTHRIHNEMSATEVAAILGESGERQFDDSTFKTNGGYYQTTDVGYQWGPDSNGRSIVLFFRDGKLIQFDPNELLKVR